MHKLRRAYDVRVARVRFAETDVVQYRAGKQMRRLQDVAEARLEPELRAIPVIGSVDADFTLRRFIKAAEQIDDRALARTCFADERDGLACFDVQREIVEHDLLIVRELTSGLYYGTPRGVSGSGPDERAINTLTYTRAEVEQVARVAFELARGRRRKLTSVDKSNVLENSQLWRRVVIDVARDYPDVTLDHLLVDNCAMQLVVNPRRFDVVLTENMFGDILSDEAAVLSGSIGMLASASVGAPRASGLRSGLYEPVHGSAPDIAGRNIANPLGAIGSAAALLDYTFGLAEEAAAVRTAIDAVIDAGTVTADLKRSGTPYSTTDVGKAVCEAIKA